MTGTVNMDKFKSQDKRKRIQKLKELNSLLAEKQTRVKYNKIDTIFPDEGRFSRDKYPKHLEFFKAGKTHKQRALMGGNRIGKTLTGSCELTYHATGLYPDWWEGRVFDHPIDAWVVGTSNEATKDIIQKELLGVWPDIGTGIIPKDKIIGKPTMRPGVPEAVQTARIRHISGGISVIGFKSYEQERDKFQGTHKDVIWGDEEMPERIYSESLMRTTDTGDHRGPGMMFCTFTPLLGMSNVVQSFLPGGRLPSKEDMEKPGSKFIIQVMQSEVPHLSEADKKEILDATPLFERQARSEGVPQLGAGKIYQVAEEDILVEPFPIPEHWERAYGMDVGWKKTAAIWGAKDPDTGEVFLYSEYYMGREKPPTHASGIITKSRKDPKDHKEEHWMVGAIDPASNASNQTDGTRLRLVYEDLGLILVDADNSVEAGIMTVEQMLGTGQLKVFNTLTNWLNEFRMYRRNEDGKIVKERDHLMDAMRYLFMTEGVFGYPPEDGDEMPFKIDELGGNTTTGY